SQIAVRTARPSGRIIRQKHRFGASRGYACHMSIVLNWNGETLPDDVREQMPEELQHLPSEWTLMVTDPGGGGPGPRAILPRIDAALKALPGLPRIANQLGARQRNVVEADRRQARAVSVRE